MGRKLARVMLLLAVGSALLALGWTGPAQPETGCGSLDFVLLIRSGTSPATIGYSPNGPDTEQRGPEAFWVMSDGRIRILDTLKDRVVDYASGMVVAEMALSEGYEAMDMVVGSLGLTYVLSGTVPKQIVALNSDGETAATWVLPPSLSDLVYRLQLSSQGLPEVVCFDGRSVPVAFVESGDWAANSNQMGLAVGYETDSRRASITGPHAAVALSGQGSIREVTVWKVDQGENVYLSYLDLAETSEASGDLVVAKYAATGKRVGVVRVPQENLWSWPCRWLSVSPEGKAFVFLPQVDGIAVYRAELGTDYQSRIDPSRASLLDRQAGPLIAGGVESLPPDISRAEVNTNCNSNIGHSWTYNRVNGEPIPAGVSKPDWLGSVPYGTTVQGIPYCWGGYDSVSTSRAWANYADAMAHGAFAGNVTCAGNYKTGTAGLDCVGFVSACMEWGTYVTMSDIYNYESYPILASQRTYMDIYVKLGSHILFYYQDGVDGIVSKESTTTGNDKCQSRVRTWSWLTSGGYELRRMYSIDPNP